MLVGIPVVTLLERGWSRVCCVVNKASCGVEYTHIRQSLSQKMDQTYLKFEICDGSGIMMFRLILFL